uniref:SFRICE_006118 n=1 Tax=Spodoptera frugiperda TaxID=7108 RepID=A0A2H1V762_SPOFR
MYKLEHKLSVGEPCFTTNGSARLELYHSLTENRRETTLALCFDVFAKSFMLLRCYVATELRDS